MRRSRRAGSGVYAFFSGQRLIGNHLTTNPFVHLNFSFVQWSNGYYTTSISIDLGLADAGNHKVGWIDNDVSDCALDTVRKKRVCWPV